MLCGSLWRGKGGIFESIMQQLPGRLTVSKLGQPCPVVTQGAYHRGLCRGPIAPGARWVGAVAGRTPSAPWMDSLGLGKTASPAAFLAGGAWPSPEPLPPCQPSSGWLLILDVVCRQRGLQPAPLLGPQREVSGVRAEVGRHTAGRAARRRPGVQGLPSPGTISDGSLGVTGEQPQEQATTSRS